MQDRCSPNHSESCCHRCISTVRFPNDLLLEDLWQLLEQKILCSKTFQSTNQPTTHQNAEESIFYKDDIELIHLFTGTLQLCNLSCQLVSRCSRITSLRLHQTATLVSFSLQLFLHLLTLPPQISHLSSIHITP